MPDGDSLTIKVRVCEKNNHFIVEIEDGKPGISPNVRNRNMNLFSPQSQ